MITDIIFMSFLKVAVQVRVSFPCPTLFSTKKDIAQKPKLVTSASNVTVQ